jgi:regulator of replication initiation timing
MSAVYNPQAELIAEIERLEIEARDLRKRLDHASTPEDLAVLEQQLADVQAAVVRLQARLD